MKKIVKPISIGLELVFCSLAVVCVAVWALGKDGLINPIYPMVVLSGSMEPEIKTGSVVLVTPKPLGYKIGDVITYSRGGKNYTTHRIKALIDQSGSIAYLTQGDANNTPDPIPVTKAEVKGATLFTLPYLGYLFSQIKTPYGFILLVIIPATILIYEELRSVKHETVKLVKRKPKKPVTPPAPNPNYVRTYRTLASISLPHPITNAPPKIAKVAKAPVKKPRYNAPIPPAASSLNQRFYLQAGISKLTMILPVAALMTAFIGFSGAYFSDTEISSGNVMGAGTWGPPSPVIANHLVINEILPNTNQYAGGTQCQWIELYNGYDTQINLKDYKLSDGQNQNEKIVNGNAYIVPDEIVLIAKSEGVWQQCYPDITGVQKLNLGGDANIDYNTLILKDANDIPIDTVIWGLNSLTPSINESIERSPKGQDTASDGVQFNPGDFIENSNPSPGSGLSL